MKDKKYFCYEIFKNIAVISHNGKIRYSPCSWYMGHTSESDTMDIETALQSNEHQKLKEMIDNDQPIPGCEHCYLAEKNGLSSRRLASKQNYEEFIKDTKIEGNCLTGIDYSIGNLCNLKCVICHPGNSSAWYSDWKKLYPNSKDEKYDKHNQILLEDSEILKNLKFIHFHGGGEPLMVDNHVKLLKAIEDPSQIRVAYNTNGTVIPSQEVLELWEKCRLVEIYFSIDAVSDQFEYQRTNADWQEVVENIKWFKDNMPHNHMFNINCVWSLLNIYYLDRMIEWKKKELDTNRYGDPVNLIFQKANEETEVTHIDPRLRDILMTKYRDYPELQTIVKSIPVRDEPQTRFLDYIQRLDEIRNADYSLAHSEWAELIGFNHGR